MKSKFNKSTIRLEGSDGYPHQVLELYKDLGTKNIWILNINGQEFFINEKSLIGLCNFIPGFISLKDTE